MVLQNRLGYGFNGYQVPPTPRATRSARRRCSIEKKVDDNQMCAFDLLATVAGKLLLEGQVFSSSSNTLKGKETCAIAKDSIKKEQLDEDNTSKVEPSNLVSGAPGVRYSTKEFSLAHNDDCSVLSSVITSDCSEKIACADKFVNSESKIQPGSGKLETPWKASYSTKPCMSSLDDLAVRYRKPPALVSQENRVKVPLGTDHVPFSACRDDVKLVVRDDDENSFGCTQPSTAKRAFRPPPCIGDHRIRKLLASKYWKAAPKLKAGEYCSADLETKYVYQNRKICYKRKRSLRDYPFKKRLLYDRSSVSNSHGGITSEGISSSPRKGFSCDASGSGATLHGAFGTPASVASRHTPFQSRDSHVNLRIKSFKVPELFIEIPETATVGSLKRSVMQAVNAILGGGLRVGVLLQGKKIRDDNKTLLQTALAHENKLDALGFSLEPTPSPSPLALCNEDHPLLSCEPPQPLTRYPTVPSVVHNIVEQSASDALPDHRLGSLCNFVESDHDSAPSPPDMSIDKSSMDFRALVTVTGMDAETLAVVPMRKSKRSEAVERRIRRPFSVSEVEALVHAVEKIGTGRWRDVKLRAFDNAKHRTYVDLKDKWKTLVHTARISPQQRRGEPVPQELLDRVLDAHAYWSQQQAKQQLKQQAKTCLLLS